VRGRIKSVVGIQKITASMKMVAAARLGKQERTTFASRPFAASLQAGFAGKNKELPLEGKKQLVLLVTSDKGLCGALNSTLVRPLQLELRKNPGDISVACVGVKVTGGRITFCLFVAH
jgi:F-type H+-transporting ATPase subunit gamma